MALYSDTSFFEHSVDTTKRWGRPYWLIIFNVLAQFQKRWENTVEQRDRLMNKCIENIGIIVAALPCNDCRSHTEKAMMEYGVYSMRSPEEVSRFFLNLRKEIRERENVRLSE